MNKKLKVTDLAKKYGVSAKEIIKELNGQGVDTPEAEKSVIPDDMVELIDSYLADLYSADADVPASTRDSRKGKGAPKKGGFSDASGGGKARRKGPAPSGDRSAGGEPASGGEVDRKSVV